MALYAWSTQPTQDELIMPPPLLDGLTLTDNGGTSNAYSLYGRGAIELYGKSNAYIDFHYNLSSADYTSRILVNDAGEMEFHYNGTPSNYTYNGRTGTFNLLNHGSFFNNGRIESNSYFFNNRTESGGGYYVYINNIHYGQFYVETVGTTSVRGQIDLSLGNNKTSTTDGNARGTIILYGNNANRAFITPSDLTSDITLGATVDRFEMPKLRITSTADISGTSTGSPPFSVGPLDGEHIEIDPNEVYSKANATSVKRFLINYETSGGLTVGGTIVSTNNGNSVEIGSQNASYTHIYNSADIPFVFNKTVMSTNGNLGNTTYPWHQLYIGKGGEDKGIWFIGTHTNQRVITFLDGPDEYGVGIKIGGGGVTVIGAGEAAGTLLTNVNPARSVENLYLTADGSVEIYYSQNSYDAAARAYFTSGSTTSGLQVGINGNTTYEIQSGVNSGAGRLYMYSAAAADGNRGFYGFNHAGTGAAFLVANQSNELTSIMKFRGTWAAAASGVANLGTSSIPWGTIYTSNWFRSTGNTGWYSQTYGGGWYMIDTNWIRSYGSKDVYVNTDLRADGSLWGGKIRITDYWIGFYAGKGDATTRYGYIALNSASSSGANFAFVKEQGGYFTFNSTVYINTTNHIFRIGTNNTSYGYIFTTATGGTSGKGELRGWRCSSKEIEPTGVTNNLCFVYDPGLRSDAPENNANDAPYKYGGWRLNNLTIDVTCAYTSGNYWRFFGDGAGFCIPQNNTWPFAASKNSGGGVTWAVENTDNNVALHTNSNAGVYHRAKMLVRSSTSSGYGTSGWLIYIAPGGAITKPTTSDSRSKINKGEISSKEVFNILNELPINNFVYKEDVDKDNLELSGCNAQDLRDILLKYNYQNRNYIQVIKNEPLDLVDRISTLGEKIRLTEDATEEEQELYRQLTEEYAAGNYEDVYYDLTLPEEEYHYTVDYTNFIPLLIKGWQIQQEKIEQQKEIMNLLWEEIEKLKLK